MVISLRGISLNAQISLAQQTDKGGRLKMLQEGEKKKTNPNNKDH